MNYKEVELDNALDHFKDWQRSVLCEIARARMNIGDYKVLQKFKTKDDNVWAEKLLDLVSGPTQRQIIDEQRATQRDRIPRQQGVGLARLNSIQRSLESSFSEIPNEVIEDNFDHIEIDDDPVHNSDVDPEPILDVTIIDMANSDDLIDDEYPPVLRKRRQILYEEPVVDVDDVQERIDNIIGKNDDDDEYIPTKSDDEEMDEDDIDNVELEKEVNNLEFSLDLTAYFPITYNKSVVVYIIISLSIVPVVNLI